MNKKNIIIIFLVIVIISLISGIIVISYSNKNNFTFILYGNKEITIYENDNYYEYGFLALDSNNKKINNKVIIESNLNNQKKGNYTIKYTLKSKTLTRIIHVLKDPLKDITFTLKGSKTINLELNETFNDPLFICFNNVSNIDLSENVNIINKINNQKKGSYEILYKLTIGTKEKTLTRNVIILDSKQSVKLDNDKMTNKNVNINFTSNIVNFSYLVDPNNKIIYQKETNFQASKNGDYKFTVYDNENNTYEHIITINNIDKISPKILSCKGLIKDGKTNIIVESNDNDIKSYVINNNTFTNNAITINQILENPKITIYDKANNYDSINCHTYYKQIEPKGNEKLIHNINSNTLKAWIELIKRDNRTDFYVSHIWAKDAYNQMKTNVPDNFGKELIKPKDLLNNALIKTNSTNKVAIAVNGGGFVKKDVWATNYYNTDPSYNQTSTSPIVIVNGKIIRDLTNRVPSGPNYTYGLKRNGYLEYYTFKGGINNEDNNITKNKIINDGILNTIAFAPILVYDYKLQNNDKNKNIRQGLCQIDKNNFVLITDIYKSPRDGFCFEELGQYMINLGCQIGFNLDGGGSTSLIVKNYNNEIEVVTGNERQIADILYFTE